MLEFNINLESKEVYTLKNFSFDIHNNGSADLQIDDIRTSSNNVSTIYTKTPFIIPQNKFYTLSGYLKIINIGDSTGNDYIECDVSWTDEFGETVTDVYRYFLNYNGTINIGSYTSVFTISNVEYISNMLLLVIDLSENLEDQELPNIVLKSIDGNDVYIFPKIYRISANKVVYAFMENSITSLMVTDAIQFHLVYKENNLDINKISYRSI
jgi:hypothetical protein